MVTTPKPQQLLGPKSGHSQAFPTSAGSMAPTTKQRLEPFVLLFLWSSQRQRWRGRDSPSWSQAADSALGPLSECFQHAIWAWFTQLRLQLCHYLPLLSPVLFHMRPLSCQSHPGPGLACHARLLSRLSRVQLFATPGTIARQAPLSVGDSPGNNMEWVATPSSGGSSQPRDWTHVSCTAVEFFPVRTSREAKVGRSPTPNVSFSLCMISKGLSLLRSLSVDKVGESCCDGLLSLIFPGPIRAPSTALFTSSPAPQTPFLSRSASGFLLSLPVMWLQAKRRGRQVMG